jgi:hypothetical protein
MYTLIGQPWKTSAVVRVAQTLFTNAPNGVTGNDDLGAMSAWYLFGAMGVYPGMPGTGQLLLSSPRFESVEIDIGSGRVLRVRAPGADSGKLRFVMGLEAGGCPPRRMPFDSSLKQSSSARSANDMTIGSRHGRRNPVSGAGLLRLRWRTMPRPQAHRFPVGRHR